MRSTAATPLGLRGSPPLFPKVAEYSNLGLSAATPSELHTTNCTLVGLSFPRVRLLFGFQHFAKDWPAATTQPAHARSLD